jgi:DUF2971 family protein
LNIYKYLSPARTDILKNMKIRFTQTFALNDPFESFPSTVDRKSEDWYKNKFNLLVETELKKYPFLTESEKISLIQKQQKLFPDYLEKWTDPQKINKLAFESQKMSSYISGILSLSKKMDNILMWSHYASSHQGFVIEFDPNHVFFRNKVHPVIYSDNRAELDLSEKRQSGELFIKKSKDWGYEEEVRMLKNLIEPIKTENDIQSLLYMEGVSDVEMNTDVKLFDFPKESIKSIIFGWKSKAELKENIIKLLQSADLEKVELYHAFPHEYLFKMKICNYKKT